MIDPLELGKTYFQIYPCVSNSDECDTPKWMQLDGKSDFDPMFFLANQV